MGLAPVAYVLWTCYLRHNPANPAWPDRDRFVLSAGHASMLLYSLLYLTGYGLTLDDIKAFRQWGSRTPGHPECGLTPGVEVTSGPLGQGFGAGVGMAIAATHLAATFNRPDHEMLNHYVYGIVTDGDLMEGVSSEAASLAGHLRLGRIIYLYDDNRISIDGPTDLTFTEDRAARFEAYGWHVQKIEDGNDVEAIHRAIQAARADPRPSLIVCRTHIGYGAPTKQDTHKAHGEPLGEEELNAAKQNLGWPLEPRFHIPEDVLAFYRQAAARGREAEDAWQRRFEAYRGKYPDLAAELERRLSGQLPQGWDRDLPAFPPDSKGVATRAASGKVLNALAAKMPELFGGSADLTPSNNTWIEGSSAFQWDNPQGRYVHFGVREHAMGAILNGLALHGGLTPYGGTFLVFADYMRPAIRIAALSRLPVIYIFTHDSIGLGEDGPTHQPIEQLASLRAMPNLVVIRAADANETTRAWRVAIARRDGPTALLLTRQAVPILQTGSAPAVEKGGYVMANMGEGEGEPDLILMASGSEVSLIYAAGEQLAAERLNVRVVSFPSWELFEQQEEAYRQAVLPERVRARLAVEAGAGLGWERYVGSEGGIISLERFGVSAPGKVLFEKFGFTVDNVVAQARRVLAQASRVKQ